MNFINFSCTVVAFAVIAGLLFCTKLFFLTVTFLGSARKCKERHEELQQKHSELLKKKSQAKGGIKLKLNL